MIREDTSTKGETVKPNNREKWRASLSDDRVVDTLCVSRLQHQIIFVVIDQHDCTCPSSWIPDLRSLNPISRIYGTGCENNVTWASPPVEIFTWSWAFYSCVSKKSTILIRSVEDCCINSSIIVTYVVANTCSNASYPMLQIVTQNVVNRFVKVVVKNLLYLKRPAPWVEIKTIVRNSCRCGTRCDNEVLDVDGPKRHTLPLPVTPKVLSQSWTFWLIQMTNKRRWLI